MLLIVNHSNNYGRLYCIHYDSWKMTNKPQEYFQYWLFNSEQEKEIGIDIKMKLKKTKC